MLPLAGDEVVSTAVTSSDEDGELEGCDVHAFARRADGVCAVNRFEHDNVFVDVDRI